MKRPALLPPNLARLEVPRQGNGRTADLVTVWRTPYPVLTNYKVWCGLVNLSPFAGGDYLKQGTPDAPGYITSGYRQFVVEGNIHSPHLFGFAIDVAIGDVHRQLAVAPSALNYFNRVGIYPDNGFIHLDLAPDIWIKKYHKRQFWCRMAGRYHSFDSFRSLTEFVREANA